jgi:asparagine synthase (glutamine-hydrolysing)
LRAEKVAGVDAHDVQREKICAKQYGVEVKAPFLEKTFAARAMEIPAIENLRGKYGALRKNALRMLAEKMRVPKEIVTAPKKAMQYGSGVAKRVNA